MLYAHERGICVPVPTAARGDNEQVSVIRHRTAMEGDFAMRLLTFLPGKLFIEIPYEPAVLFKVGVELAKLDQVLEVCLNRLRRRHEFHKLLSFKGYKCAILAQRVTLWSLLSIPKLGNFMKVITDPDRLALVQQIIKDFDHKVLSLAASLPTALIHGDFNEQNILVEKDGENSWNVTGILDFGDVHEAPQIFDLAISCTYMMLECKTMDPLLAPRHCIRGYQTIRKLSELEWTVLPLCVMSRLAQSLILGAYSYSLEPTNEYLLTTARTGWNILAALKECGYQDLVQLWKTIEEE